MANGSKRWERLVDVLRWYAAEETYERASAPGQIYLRPILDDGGDRARRAVRDLIGINPAWRWTTVAELAEIEGVTAGSIYLRAKKGTAQTKPHPKNARKTLYRMPPPPGFDEKKRKNLRAPTKAHATILKALRWYAEMWPYMMTSDGYRGPKQQNAGRRAILMDRGERAREALEEARQLSS